MTGPTDTDRDFARQGRQAALVVAVAMAGWIAAQWLGRRMGWDASFAFLFDLAALAAFFWALVVCWRLWRRQREAGK
ncbi:MAG: DUF5337 family protein [Paracoccaceae bacterium]